MNYNIYNLFSFIIKKTMEYLIDGEIIDTYGGDYTYRDVWLDDGIYYERCYGAKPTETIAITDEKELKELLKY